MLPADAAPPAEDCLYLNVWAPTGQATARPVLVWVYGGGFEVGTASTEVFSGQRFAAEHDLVVVTVNYRVGFLGFGHLPDELPSNLGLRDLIAALAWVHENIGAFGGDATRVTVMGESAGGFLAAALAAAPTATGLVHRIIAFSGAASRLVRAERVAELTRKWLAEVGVSNRAQLCDAALPDLLAAQPLAIPQEIGARNAADVNALGVTLDVTEPEGVLTAHPFADLTTGAGQHLDVMLGCTNAELSTFRAFMGAAFAPASRADLADELQRNGVAAERIEALLERYEADTTDLGEARERMLTDWIYRLPAARLAAARATAPGSTFMIEFRAEDDGPLGHGGDIVCYFPRSDEEAARGQAVRSAIANFAATGNAGWPRFGANGHVYVVGGASGDGLYDSMLAAWKDVERP